MTSADYQVAATLRYPDRHYAGTHLDRFEDVVGFARYFCVRDYVRETLEKRHSLATAEAKRRTESILPHVRIALEYVDQARSGPEHLAFLPGYYAILNMMKAMILAGPSHADLVGKNLLHGANYNVQAKDSQSVLTDEITVWPNGVLATFYKTVTGTALKKKRQIQMRDVYPFVADIGSEFAAAAGGSTPVHSIGVFGSTFETSGQNWRHIINCHTGSAPILSAAHLRPFIGYQKVGPLTFHGPLIAQNQADPIAVLRRSMRPHLLYHPAAAGFGQGDPAVGKFAVSSSHFQWPEELPIALLFFHMSSVVRYKPEFLERIQESRYWPMLNAARTHALFRMLVLFWSFMGQRTLWVTAS